MHAVSCFVTNAGHERRLAVEDKEQRVRILSSIHVSSHMGVNRTLNMITAKYYWPGLTNDVKVYVSNIYVGQRFA